MYYYNLLTQFYKKQDTIILKALEQTITIEGNDSLYDFLVYALENPRITPEDIQRFNVNDTMIEFLVQYTYLIPVGHYNKGTEALMFHNYISNPNNHSILVNDNNLKDLYGHQSDRLLQLINRKVFSISDDIVMNSSTNNNLNISKRGYSSRFTGSPHSLDAPYLLSSLSYLNMKMDSHYMYASGGGQYSVFQLIVTNQDEVLITNKEKLIIHKTTIQGLYRELSKSIIKLSEYDTSSYGAIVILLADTSLVFKKYSNRGYRYIMMESGSIGLLFRMMYSERGYLEL